MLAEEIRNNWKSSPMGYARELQSIKVSGYKAWTIRTANTYGVAIPLDTDIEISEKFSGAYIYSGKITLNDSTEINTLILSADAPSGNMQFASLCAEFVYPGTGGEFREELINNPELWWQNWKELLGNRNIDERVYDVIGELVIVKYLCEHGRAAEWNGPDGATYDIDSDGEFYEIKSTVAREKREITLSNQFQLAPPNGSVLKLIFCQFELASSGYCINQLVDELGSMGYSVDALNKKLACLGLQKGKSARKRCYVLHAMTEYLVDDSFPAIRKTSFVGGDLPASVREITYTVTLDGIQGKNLLIE